MLYFAKLGREERRQRREVRERRASKDLTSAEDTLEEFIKEEEERTMAQPEEHTLSEDPYKHLKEFYIVRDGMRPHGVTDE